jgi:hypothetical protein
MCLPEDSILYAGKIQEKIGSYNIKFEGFLLFALLLSYQFCALALFSHSEYN